MIVFEILGVWVLLGVLTIIAWNAVKALIHRQGNDAKGGAMTNQGNDA